MRTKARRPKRDEMLFKERLKMQAIIRQFILDNGGKAFDNGNREGYTILTDAGLLYVWGWYNGDGPDHSVHTRFDETDRAYAMHQYLGVGRTGKWNFYNFARISGEEAAEGFLSCLRLILTPQLELFTK